CQRNACFPLFYCLPCFLPKRSLEKYLRR
ncbi:MAG: hypothetical protein AVDCRST_MAG96-4126, partial [uncultured Segetibacter sp.]